LAFILAVLVFTGVVQPWHILVLSFLLGICNSFDAPARQAFILELVDRDVMTNAIALNATMFNSAVVVGPAVGGLAYAAFGPGWCFTLNGISFISVIIALVLMKLNPVARLTRKATAMSDIKEGLKYTLSNPTLVMLISNLSVTTIFGIGVATLIPAWAVNVLGGDAATNGFLVSARGLGALIGALMIASAGRARGRGRTWTYASIVLPLVMFFFVFVRWMPLVLLGMAGVGWGFVSLNNTTNAMVQSQVEDEIRGRVMGIYMLVFFGSMPLGSLIMGEMATLVGEPLTVLISAAILLIFALLVIWRRPEMRRLE
jgi:predicted MFS family arabinose efflux permease